MTNVSFGKQIKLDTSALDGLNLPPEHLAVLKSQLTSQFTADMANYEKEFARYKQDCRKRALDLAHSELGKYAGRVWSDEETLQLAGKYYNWLISIPQ